MPEASLATGIEGVRVNTLDGDQRRLHLWGLTDRTLRAIREFGFVIDNNTGFPCVTVICGAIENTIRAHQVLWKHGILVTPAVFPAMPIDRGASLIRPGIQQVLADALGGRFDIVVAEALDRISRDQEDVAGVFKRMAFAGVKIITLSEGEITHLHTLVSADAASKKKLPASRTADLRDMLMLVRSLEVKPAKGRRRDLKKVENVVGELRVIVERWE